MTRGGAMVDEKERTDISNAEEEEAFQEIEKRQEKEKKEKELAEIARERYGIDGT